jgi:hypothetical protein
MIELPFPMTDLSHLPGHGFAPDDAPTVEIPALTIAECAAMWVAEQARQREIDATETPSTEE